MNTNEENLLALTRALARELKPGARDFGRLGLDDKLERDFGIDSLARVELISRIGRGLGMELGEAALSAFAARARSSSPPGPTPRPAPTAGRQSKSTPGASTRRRSGCWSA